MPALQPSLIDVLAGALAADESRCCLRGRLARVPDPRSRLGRWHPLVFVLALAVCAFKTKVLHSHGPPVRPG